MARILVVDDDSMVIRMIGFILKKSGHECTGASCGAQGIAMLRSEAPDLVLLDVEMPGENGMDVLKEIRDDSDISGAKVCLMSGTVDDELRDKAQKLGSLGFLIKPVAAAELMDILKMAEI
ncbi:response regulator [Ruminococcus sp.]|uniref:response regulator n=1 Tax=Ruminococcus sp. TaxID=41978 RepID=UPI00258F7217|nr:response regulator [Ruminococcus sp.]MCR5021250.1 response regulator [Ruminococcus sp.]